MSEVNSLNEDINLHKKKSKSKNYIQKANSSRSLKNESHTDKETINMIETIDTLDKKSRKKNMTVDNISESKIENYKSQNLIYNYPICVYKEQDPLKNYRVRTILSRKKRRSRSIGNFTSINNNMKYNFYKKNINSIFNNDKLNSFLTKDDNKSSSNINNNYTSSINNYNGSNLFFTSIQDYKDKNIDPVVNINNSLLTTTKYIKKRNMNKSNSMEDLNPYSKKSIEILKGLQILEMEKRSNYYNKIRMANVQRMALNNFCSLNDTKDYFTENQISLFNTAQHTYNLKNIQKQNHLGLKDYYRYKIKLDHEKNSKQYYNFRAILKNRKYDNKLPELINIKKDKFKFHVFHDKDGLVKNLNIPSEKNIKMTKSKVMDLKIMAKINKIQDPDIIEIYKKVIDT